LPAIERWRHGLDNAQQRRLNHPNAVWFAWRRTIKPQLRPIVKTKRYSRAVYWPSDAERRAVMAIREARTNDFFIMARVALESAG